ncbi:GNAT family N-acetyltransferase [Actinoplanes bogorensis]|uniref:GNAT family N-acetyltransferase n=1 Tax=Paractinoplanes bogorensis TaxID=1610840 RepID=A0ABS5Z013_9ACTN|nr:GNAT family N-acetyltransferase [Actinoplanes bogorensis]MBU2669025.1 GNAT family N-acetyltransferase [Actinoplanes bogorensis]
MANLGVRLTPRLRLEPIGPRHAADLLALYRDPAVAEWYGRWTWTEVERETARMARLWRSDGVHKWMAYDRVTGLCIGRGGLSRAVVDGQARLELGWVLHGRFWGRGYATEIGRAGLTYAADVLDTDEVVSFTETGNRRSRAVMERLGFRHARDFLLGGEGFSLYTCVGSGSARS